MGLFQGNRQAVSRDGINIPEGQKVKVIERRGMRLYVGTDVIGEEDMKLKE
ncbi:MAG: hypothetical protein A4E53_00191 [Pelotomaculum sp. PtaB.Bin104]|nr:MAG: hypothetical protein A4E53_00191 [Pelotomaculum sp. PtaB.Bin104]